MSPRLPPQKDLAYLAYSCLAPEHENPTQNQDMLSVLSQQVGTRPQADIAVLVVPAAEELEQGQACTVDLQWLLSLGTGSGTCGLSCLGFPSSLCFFRLLFFPLLFRFLICSHRWSFGSVWRSVVLFGRVFPAYSHAHTKVPFWILRGSSTLRSKAIQPAILLVPQVETLLLWELHSLLVGHHHTPSRSWRFDRWSMLVNLVDVLFHLLICMRGRYRLRSWGRSLVVNSCAPACCSHLIECSTSPFCNTQAHTHTHTHMCPSL